MPITKSTSSWRRQAIPQSISLIKSFTTSSLALIVVLASIAAGVVYNKSIPLEFILTTASIVEWSKQTSVPPSDESNQRPRSSLLNNSVKDTSHSLSDYCSRVLRSVEKLKGGDIQMTHKSLTLPTALPSSAHEEQHPKSPFQKFHNFFFKHDSSLAEERPSGYKQFPNAFPHRLVLTDQQRDLIIALSGRVQRTVPNFYNRAAHVSWGGIGGSKWYYPVGNHHYGAKGVDALDGGHLLYAYLRTMKWPADLHSHFPTKLCVKGCNAEVAIEHTLEFREKFKPWYVTPDAMHENRDGFIYHRGYSPAIDEEGKFALVWYRPGIHKLENPFAYLRAMVHTLDRAVADSLRSSHSREGKVNVVIDMHGFSFSMVPKLSEVKMFLKIFQDHLPGRMGTVFLLNVSAAAEIAYSLVKPLLAKEAREKIFIIPHDPEKKRRMLQLVIEQEYIPDWLGGTDKFKFNSETYYPQSLRFSNTEGLEYIQTMPYHALHH
jgi:hypothetical protein